MSVFAVTMIPSGSWENATKKALERITIIVHKSTIDMFSRIIKRTPVDKGRTRGNWQFQIGSVPSGIANILDKSGQKAKAAMISDIALWDPQITAYFVNNVPWILTLEDGGYPMSPKTGNKTVAGYSKQAPAGMVKITIAEFKNILVGAAHG